MEEEWISLNEYCRRFQMGPDKVKQMITQKEVEFFVTEKGYYKIKVGGDMVSREVFEQEKQRRIEAETTLNLLKNILIKDV